MHRAYKFLLRPTLKQVAALAACLEDHRELYNAALEERREAWSRAKSTIRYFDQSKQMKDIRAADPDGQSRWSAKSQELTLRRLQRAFDAFFLRVKASLAPGFPRFKGRGWFNSVTWEDGDGARWNSTPHDPTMRVRLQGIGHVRVHQHRGVLGRVRTITCKREGSRWYVILSCDNVPTEPLPATGAVAGIDLGVASLVTTSDGRHLENPRHLASSAQQVAAAQKALARKKQGSKRRQLAVARVSALHAKVQRGRRDSAHKAALDLTRRYDVIVCEALQIANMTKRAAPRPDGTGGYLPNGSAAKSGLNRSILDAGWGVFLTILTHKAESAGRELITVNPANTSRTCARCGHCAKENRVTQAQFRCTACGHEAHADINAAINILRAGLALREAAA